MCCASPCGELHDKAPEKNAPPPGNMADPLQFFAYILVAIMFGGGGGGVFFVFVESPNLGSTHKQKNHALNIINN